MSKKIAIVLDSSNFGGIESHVFELAKALNSSGETVEVRFIQAVDAHPLYEKLDSHGIAYTRSNSTLDFIKALKSNKPDIIHTHGYKAGIIGRIAARILSIKCVSTFHAGEALSGKLAVYDWLDRQTAFLANRVFSVSTTISASIKTQNRVMNNFIDMRSLFMTKGSKIAFVGRLSHEKGPDLLLEIAKQLDDKQFHIFGAGPLDSALKDAAPSNICFHGQKNDMDKTWDNIEVLLITSRREGLPMVAIEAMARGIPVIAFDVGELSSLIDTGENGWLVKEMEIEAFSDAIRHWCESSSSYKRHIKYNAIKKARREFSSHALLPQYRDSYKYLYSDEATA